MTLANAVPPRPCNRSSHCGWLPRAATAIAALLLSLTASVASAQDSSAVAGDRWLTSFSIGLPGAGAQPAPEMFTLGVQWTQLRPGRLGPDVSIGVMPRALQFGAMVGGLRLGVALPVEITPAVLLVPSSGVSVVGGIGSGGGGGVAGLNAGLSTVLLTSSGAGVRTGVTWHRFGEMRRAIWLWEFGIVRGR